MAKQVREEHDDCIRAFTDGNPVEAEQLLSCIPQSGVELVTTTFKFSDKMIASVSLLHLAAYRGWENVVTALVSVYKCDANCKEKEGHIPLHYAAYKGRLEVVKYFLIELYCDPMSKSNDGYTALHFACSNGHLNIAQYLIKETNCIASCENNNGDTPLHFACSSGHLDIAQYLIREENCNPSCENSRGRMPLHYACSRGHLNIVQYLIEEENCNPSWTQRVSGCTPLHFASSNKHADIVKYLLSTGRVDPQAVWGKCGPSVLDIQSLEGYDEISKLFQPIEECRNTFPIHKLILVGDSGAGKSTFAKQICLPSSETALVDVPSSATAGIVPYSIQVYSLHKTSKFYFVMYDFSGQQEYYSSHAAVLEHMMQKSRPTFLCMVDLTKSKERIGQSLNCWLSFIDNACSSTAEGTPCVAIIGSHADQVASLEVNEKQLVLEEIAVKRVIHQQYTGYFSMNCRYPDSASRRRFNDHLFKQKRIVASQPAIIYNTYAVNEFLHTELNVVGCPLRELFSIVADRNRFSLPSDETVLTEILTTLNDRGLILFIRHDESSWIIVDRKAFLNEVIGTIFAPSHFKEHPKALSSNTGIISVVNLKEVFPKHNTEMLIGVLTSLDFCRPIDFSMLQYTNLQTTPSHSTDDLLFFPGLIQLERPDSLVEQGTLEFGWCLSCIDPSEFFTSRFLHVLLLAVAYECPLASHDPVKDLQCVVWRNGIFLRNSTITTVIELLENNRSVLVAMSCDGISAVEHAKLRSSLIRLVLRLQQQHCPHLKVRESVVSPDLIRKYPRDLGNLPDSDLFDMRHVARCLLLRKKGVPNRDGHGCLSLQTFPFEPYHQLGSLSICQLLNPEKADQPVPDYLLQEVRQLCDQPNMEPQQKFCEMREYLDSLSLFAGKNPLVSTSMLAYQVL